MTVHDTMIRLRHSFVSAGWSLEEGTSGCPVPRVSRFTEVATVILMLDPHLSVWTAWGDPATVADWIGQARSIFDACIARGNGHAA